MMWPLGGTTSFVQLFSFYYTLLDLSHKYYWGAGGGGGEGCLYELSGQNAWKYPSKFTASSLIGNFKSTEVYLRYLHFRSSIFRSFFFIFLRICEIQGSLSFLFLKKLQGKSVFLWRTTSWKPITFTRYNTRHFSLQIPKSWQVLNYTGML